ncbi:MAG TPA: fatty acid oxidation complex subunit alpha FadJ [Gemmatimonadaceae bacterium]|jgi:3-hydroxyacyl-CoA dehydrogenase/enoyl-CoA hydratase/3-hydroxybutyryl-CoA epimerase|nr:fatty acid oxidation complex subunit alpha FadJ [Gemmatimonadaceae bacterium]
MTGPRTEMTETLVGASPFAMSVEMHSGVAVVTLDLPGEPVNKIGRGLKDEFVALFDRLERDRNVIGAVIISGKPDTFIAGADIEEFTTLTDAADAERLSRDGQALVEQFEKARIPFVAAIHGACLGAGVETAIACRWRIATNHPKTMFALPEVQLGLIPGAGGTQRLPRLIGLRAALEMILTGKNIRAKKALQTGLVDELVHPAILKRIAIERARELGTGARSRSSRPGGALGLLLDGNPVGRNVVVKRAREETLSKTQGNYPAPLAAIDAIVTGYEKGVAAGFREEARLFGEMSATAVSKQLIGLFFATTALKKDTGLAAGHVAAPIPIHKIGILGAGFMGAGIASIAVQQETVVRMKDADHGRVAKGFAAVNQVLFDRFKKRQITKVQYSDMMSLLGGTVDYSGFANVDLVIEAVFEDLAVKHTVLREVEAVIGPHAIFATNTSTIPVTHIAEASHRPERVLGMHFFSPVHKMPLLEVIVTPHTSDEVIATAVSYGKKLGKTVIVVNDGPGFYVNRILSPYINEAGRLLDEGVSIDAIDSALVKFGFPVGPITLIDEVGLDIAGKAGQIMFEAFGARLIPSESLRKVIESGRYGRKSKKGFYLYDEAGKKGDPDPSVYELFAPGRARIDLPAEEIQRRTVYAMLNEAVRCLQDGIIRSPRDGDIGAIFGIGFPPFRGGPFRMIDALGTQELVRELEELNARFSDRFEPAQALFDMAHTNARFYPMDKGGARDVKVGRDTAEPRSPWVESNSSPSGTEP